MTESQKIILRNALRETHLSENKIHDVMLLLHFKPEPVKQAFYYKSIGYTFDEIGSVIGVSKSTAWAYINDNCSDIKEYLKNICVSVR